MKTVGLLGGMSWHSTALYYQLINEGVQQRLGGLHSAQILMSSIDFAVIAEIQQKGDWDRAGTLLAEEAVRLQQAGADFLVIATNTMHISVPVIEQTINIPILHIADATADDIISQGYDCCGLLGTRFTMTMDYYKSRLQQKGLTVVVPDEPSGKRIDNIIFQELCFGNIRDDSRRDYLTTIDELVKNGAQCVIEGCTEITLLVQQQHTSAPLLDTTAIHAQAAVDFALSD